MSSSLLLIGAPLVSLVTVWFWLSGVHSVQRRYPNGPPGWPIIGNLLHLSLNHPWLRLAEWKPIYGNLLYMYGMGNNILVLNDIKAVNDLLEKKGAIYSHRPAFMVVGELMELGKSMPLRPYDSLWKLQRKIAHVALSPEAVKKYHLVQEDAAALLNKSLCDDPKAFCDQIRLAAGRIIVSVTYGLPVDSYQNEYITHAEKTMDLITKATMPGAYLADIFPAFKSIHAWLFSRQVQAGKRMILDLVSRPFDRVKEQVAAGIALPSLTSHLLSESYQWDEFTNQEEYEEAVKWVSGALFGAGAETTYSTVLTCIIAMVQHPDKQSRAQDEIDTVVGAHRLPTINDKDSLPYVGALIKETMRWYPALPLSIARKTAQDDIYDGYYIPAGTTVLPNVWSIANDCDSSRDFIPERFLNANAPTDPATYAFGFGRRVCPGRYLADNSVFIMVATLLAAFDISPEIDSNRISKPLRPQFSTGLVSYPQHFRWRWLYYNCKHSPTSIQIPTHKNGDSHARNLLALCRTAPN
ncbi:cytochrome P450 family protein [Pleurotus pulmonarius]